MKKITLFLSAMLFSVMSFAGVITFTPGEFDALESSKFDVEKDGVTLSCSSGTITADQFRFFKSQTLTVSSTAGNITSIEFTCTAANETKHGPGGFGELEGYSYADKVGTWAGSAASVTFSTTNNQVRATQVVVTIDGEGGGDTPDTPVDPEEPEEPEEPETPVDPENPGTPEEPETPVGSIDGYSKVTNAASLVAGDKVVLYCDDAQLGVTGWNGNKDATVAESGWVEYVVEVADGGFYLKDGEQYITGAESANHFKYGEKAVCGVDKDGVLACGTKFLYKNGDYYRMYTDKSSNNAYKPFYVYKAGEGGGETPEPEDPEQPEDPDQPENPDPEQPENPDTPQTGTTITGLNYADAIYVEDAEYGNYWVFDLYNDYDDDAYDYIYPDLYVEVYEAHSKTAINGTYDVLYTEYLTSADADAITTDEYAEDFVGTLTIKNVDNEGNYSFKGSFTAANGKTYTYDQVVNVYAYAYSEVDGEPMYEDIELNENGTTPENPEPEDPEQPENPETPAGEVTFDADVDKGNASLDAANQTEYTVEKDGVTMVVSKGIIGVYNNNENHYRIYKNQTLTITSTVGNIVSVEFTCTANDDAKYGPGCFTVDGGSYTYSGAVGTWTGSASKVVFTASSDQVRATEIVVKLAESTDVDNVMVGNAPVKVINNGQLFIIRGENTYNVLGAQVK